MVWHASVFPRIANRIGAAVVFLPNLIWAPGLKAPSVVTAHDLLHFRHPQKFGRLKAALLRHVIRWTISTANMVIAVSEFTAQDALRFGGASPARLVEISEGGPEAEGRGDEQVPGFFLFVGKIERSKGIDVLISAFRGSQRLAQAGYRLTIVGPDGNATEDVARATRGAEDRIDRRGFLPDEELREPVQVLSRLRISVYGRRIWARGPGSHGERRAGHRC